MTPTTETKDGSNQLKFIDLFAGIGGFHQALGHRLGHECVFASEINPRLRDLYKKNFGMTPAGDITAVDPATIPDHDILCGGFPCQAFSRAGKMLGKKDPRGKLIDTVIKILEVKRPHYLLLENVPALRTNNGGKTFKSIKRDLRKIGYDIKDHMLSPHDFGIPQKRNRLFIVAERDVSAYDSKFDWNKLPTTNGSVVSFKQFLTGFPKDGRQLEPQRQNAVAMWQDLMDRIIASGAAWPTFPIWAMEFGADYEFETRSPASVEFDFKKLEGSCGKFGKKLNLGNLPPYAFDETFADWKKGYIRNNRQFYADNKPVIDAWLKANPDFKQLIPSLQKFEWQVSRFGNSNVITDYVLQFRQSGVRVKRNDLAPTLTTVDTDVYLGWRGRYMNEREALKLQGMDFNKIEVPDGKAGIKICGNAVNVDVVAHVARELLGYAADLSHLARFSNSLLVDDE